MTTSRTYGFSNSPDPRDSIDAIEVKRESKPYEGKCEHKHPCEREDKMVVDVEYGPIASYGMGPQGSIALCRHHADYWWEEFE